MKTPFVQDYHVSTGFLHGGRANWHSTLKFPCPNCKAKLTSKYLGPTELDDCPKCGVYFWVLPEKLLPLINAANADQQAKEAHKAQLLKNRREQKEKHMVQPISPAQIPQGALKRATELFLRPFYLVAGIVMLVVLIGQSLRKLPPDQLLRVLFGVCLLLGLLGSLFNPTIPEYHHYSSPTTYRELNDRQEAERQIAERLLENNGEANAKDLSYTVQEIAERDRQIRNGTYKRP